MATSRRDFLKNSAIAGSALGVLGTPIADNATGAPTDVILTAGAKELMTSFGLLYPIFQAPHPGAGPELVAAVSNAGGLGILGGLNRLTSDAAHEYVGATRSLTKRPFAVNYLLAFDAQSLPRTLDAGAQVVHFSWGLPTTIMVSSVRSAGAKFGVQIGNAIGARAALDLGADYLVCQGVEAGGHVQSSTALYELLPKILEEARDTPVLVAGAICRGREIRQALRAGASGAMLGTRFVATQESRQHPDHKSALIKANAGDTALSVCFQDGWPGATHRALRNGTFERWEAAGCPPVGSRPGEGEVLARRVDGTTVLRYSAYSPMHDLSGAITDMAMYAGQGVEDVRDIPAAADLVIRLWTECIEASRS
jgi:nitronate monooxygenase